VNLKNAPQPIPYQGSKRQQVPVILRYLPRDTETLFEPFVGSGAVTIGAASNRAALRFHLGDTLQPLVGIWSLLLTAPDEICDEYERIWTAQLDNSRMHFDQVRESFNREHRPAQLLYLIARCVKNAIRFNATGQFNQSPDKRRLGMRPSLFRERAFAVHDLLSGKAQATCADYAKSLLAAGTKDVVYMDPPYMGVSGTRDSRYHQGLDYDRFVGELADANVRGVSYLVSFDGRCGERTYGPGLPDTLGLRKIDVHVGRSSQATLNGRADETVESLYVSSALAARLWEEEVGVPAAESVKRKTKEDQLQMSFI
jgi:DNA adenine methylase